MTSDKKSEKLFKVLHDRMKKAQQEVKSTVTVNMSDIGHKPHDDKDSAEHGSKGMWDSEGDLLSLPEQGWPPAAALLAKQETWAPCLTSWLP